MSVAGKEHWTAKGDVRIFMWEKATTAPRKHGTVLFVHGSSMADRKSTR